MRVTSSMYYHSLYGTNNLKINNDLFDVNKQIASGLKIQYAKDDVTVFTKTMGLDNEVTTLTQVKKSTQNGSKVSNQSDIVLNEFTKSMNRMRTLLLQASNGTNDEASQDAIAQELKGIEKNLKSLANSSIDGKYLFSGSAVDVKPIDENGFYRGNDKAMNAFLGSKNQQQYNVSGSELFLGEESSINREITSNVVHKNLLDSTKPLTSSSKLRDLMGDKDNDDTTDNTDYFYLRGTKSDGSSVKEKISFNDSHTIGELLSKIGDAYGNSGDLQVVDVTIGQAGEIIVKDRQKGSSKLDFHLVGAVDYSASGKADVQDIDDLDNGETKYPPDGDLFINEFSKSGLAPASGAASNIEGLVYDRTKFLKKGVLLSSNAPQIIKKGNAFADSSTKISEVADLTQTNNGTLDGSTLKLVGKNINGDDYDVSINFNSKDHGGSNFVVNGTKYDIFNMDPKNRKAVDADNMTYKQLLDVINMVVTNKLPQGTTANDYDDAIRKSKDSGSSYLSYDGKIEFHDLQAYNSDETKATISLYDPNSNDFSSNAQASIMTFNTNNALTVHDAKTDFFKTIDSIIKAVEEHKSYPDSSKGNPRTVGIENAIGMMDDLESHISRVHSKVGANTNTLDNSLQRTELLEISTKTLRSSVIDTDLAEASLKLQQLNLNYQAMLSTVGKVSKLSLVNYI